MHHQCILYKILLECTREEYPHECDALTWIYVDPSKVGHAKWIKWRHISSILYKMYESVSQMHGKILLWRHISASCIRCTRVYHKCIERMDAYQCILYKMHESVSQMHRNNEGFRCIYPVSLFQDRSRYYHGKVFYPIIVRK